MTVDLDTVHDVGILRIAAISQTDSGGLVIGGGVVLSGSKHPLAVLIMRKDVLSAHAVTGSQLTLAEVERLCPGAVAAFGKDGHQAPSSPDPV
jgi:hypothetical protein